MLACVAPAGTLTVISKAVVVSRTGDENEISCAPPNPNESSGLSDGSVVKKLKSHVELIAPGLGLALGDALGLALGDALGLGLALGDALGLALGDALGLALGEVEAAGVGVAPEYPPASKRWNCTVNSVLRPLLSGIKSNCCGVKIIGSGWGGSVVPGCR